MTVLGLTYLGNIRYYTHLYLTECVVDIHENYAKQSYRNRCEIMGANGPLTLVVPVIKSPNFDKTKVRDVRIDYSKRWQHQHWLSIVSAYKNSPYFDFYAERFEPFYRQKFDLLLDFNVGLTRLVLELLSGTGQLQFSDRYIEQPAGEDLRNSLSPKTRLSKPDPIFNPSPYWQVFSDRMPFAPNLSILDLLMCEGPGAVDVLQGHPANRPHGGFYAAC